MDIKNLITFVEVAEKNSFTKAAESLGCTQSTVSFQIKQLENELDCKLFDRINHAITLTSSGNVLLEYAKRVREQTEDLQSSIKYTKEPSGLLKMVTSDSICEVMMLNNYHTFKEKYPHISLEFTTASTDRILEILNHNEADLVMTLDNHIYSNDYIIA
ncbi:MAG: LysR family transcriptional regulator, partial [Erysipelotrichaceae bacterium]|nr:LysR family transcriptional regulator [Erysipelotrichaceae bacterium]